MEELLTFLHDQKDEKLLSWSSQVAATEYFGVSCREIEKMVLSDGLLPVHYQRNQQTITIEQQLLLFQSKVVIVGCGGLGGYILEELVRLGVGQITIVDPNIFEEHHLSNQILSTLISLRRPKVDVALERAAEVNPGVLLTAKKVHFSRHNGRELIQGADCVVDAVDNVATRLDIAAVCQDLSVPLVHGTIAGWGGHVTTIFPEEDALGKIHSMFSAEKGMTDQLGTPSFTPALVAGIEAAEVCKVLLGHGTMLRGRKLMINLLDMEIKSIPI